jgi:DNA-directed RNA polymerase subunit RPC12/RpoP
MSATAVYEEQVRVVYEPRRCAGPSGVSLGQLFTRAHEAVHAGRAAACPVCGGSLVEHGVHARCEDCGSRLG